MKKVLNSILVLVVLGCSLTPNSLKKINGISFVAAEASIDETNVSPVVAIKANYAAIMPFGFIKALHHPEIIHNTERQWFGETRAGAKQYSKALQKKQIKIMIKPQIWVWNGEFTGQIKMNNETDWKRLEDSYTNFIIEYAELAEELNAELFCIGTELELFIKHRPKYWNRLIKKIRGIYDGKLTYAANWDEYKRTPFWNKIDYIGIDAYFPVSTKKTPTFKDCMDGWKPHKPLIKNTALKYNKPVLFTEYGYRSVDYSGKEPWVFDRSMNVVNLEAQVNTTKALFETFWNEDWFAGGFVWKWFHDYEKSGGEKNHMFTPQNKPVEAIIEKYYNQF